MDPINVSEERCQLQSHTKEISKSTTIRSIDIIQQQGLVGRLPTNKVDLVKLLWHN